MESGLRALRDDEAAAVAIIRASLGTLREEVRVLRERYDAEEARLAAREARRAAATRRAVGALRVRAGAQAALRAELLRFQLRGDGRLAIEPLAARHPDAAFCRHRVEAGGAREERELRVIECFRVRRLVPLVSGDPRELAAGPSSGSGAWVWHCAPLDELLSTAAAGPAGASDATADGALPSLPQQEPQLHVSLSAAVSVPWSGVSPTAPQQHIPPGAAECAVALLRRDVDAVDTCPLLVLYEICHVDDEPLDELDTRHVANTVLGGENRADVACAAARLLDAADDLERSRADRQARRERATTAQQLNQTVSNNNAAATPQSAQRQAVEWAGLVEIEAEIDGAFRDHHARVWAALHEPTAKQMEANGARLGALQARCCCRGRFHCDGARVAVK